MSEKVAYKIQKQIDEMEEQLARFVHDFLADPMTSLARSNNAFKFAAKHCIYKIAKEVLSKHGLKIMKDQVLRNILEKACFVPFSSTSITHNLMDSHMLGEYAQFLKALELWEG